MKHAKRSTQEQAVEFPSSSWAETSGEAPGARDSPWGSIWEPLEGGDVLRPPLPGRPRLDCEAALAQDLRVADPCVPLYPPDRPRVYAVPGLRWWLCLVRGPPAGD